jgi:hypothetical protein
VPELTWDWHVISACLLWRLAPAGLVITRKDLGALPMDRVLVDHRDVSGTKIALYFVTLEQAEKLRDYGSPYVALPDSKVGLRTLEGRWNKMAVVVLWKLRKDGIVLIPADREAVPEDKILLMSGFKDDLELRFVPRAQAAQIQKSALEHEGKNIVETFNG